MASPVAAEIEVLATSADASAVRVAVRDTEPVFVGHYPGFPIFPGVCVIECAHRGAIATAPEPMELAAVESARFSAAVYPGDVIDIDLRWRRLDDGWRCTAKARTRGASAATVRLRYRAGGAPVPPAPGPAEPYAEEPGVPPLVVESVPLSVVESVPLPVAESVPLPVAELLPHRYPMLLVDRVTELVPGDRVRAVKAVTRNEPWYAGLPADADLAYPPSLLIESWGQTAGLLAVATTPVSADQVMLFGGVSDADFLAPVYPGDLVEHRVRVLRSLGDSAIFEGGSWCGDRQVMSLGRMIMAFRPAGVLRPDRQDAEMVCVDE